MTGHTSIEEIEKDYLSLLDKFVHPFEQAVSRSEIRSTVDHIDIQRPHKILDRKFKRIIRSIQNDHLPKVQPLLGVAGSGKTHYYWILKDKETENNKLSLESDLSWTIVYVPSPPMPIGIPLHILTCLIDEQGEILLNNTANNLLNKFRGDNVSSIEQIKIKIISYYGGVYSEIIRVLILYIWPDTTQDIKYLAKRWLFADTLSEEELQVLKVRGNIERDGETLALLRIINEFNGKIIIYFFDELELIYRIHGAEAEVRLWEIIKKLFNESRNSLYLTTCLLDVWARVQNNLDSTVISRFESEIQLKPFNFEETSFLYCELMNRFWKEYSLDIPPNKYFPLNENILKHIFLKSKGNPRQIIKLIAKILEKIIFNEVEPIHIHDQANSDIIKNFISNYSMRDFVSAKNKVKEKFLVEANPKYENLENLNQSNQVLPPVLQQSTQKAKIYVENETYYIDVNPTSIISSIKTMFSTIKQILTKKYGNSFSKLKFHLDYKYSLQNETKTIPLLIHSCKDKKIGFMVPLIKNWTNLSKAKAYFYILEATNVITRGKFDKIILLIPIKLIDTTTGSIVKTLDNFKDELYILEFSNESARKFIEEAHPSEINNFLKLEEFKKIFKIIYPDLPLQSIQASIQEELSNKQIEKKIEFEALKENIDDFREFLIKINE